jgi:hypothetical protein
MPTVVKVRKESAPDGKHWHIAGVCTTEAKFHLRGYVVASIRLGVPWEISSAGYRATIKVIEQCPSVGCPTAPYITTAADAAEVNNLDNLPTDGC